MSSKLDSYDLPPLLRSIVFKSPSEILPPTDELETLYAELEFLKQKSLERAKKAGEDLKAIEESMKRMKEKAKGKAKAVDKIKRERDYTPQLDADEVRPSGFYGSSSKPRLPSIPGTSAQTSSSRSSIDPRRSLADDLKKKKKKRKRENEDSDVDHEPPRPRKMTPPSTHPQPQKSMKTTSSSQAHAKAPAGPDFSLPQQISLVPPRPPIPIPPVPGPTKPTDVTDDFSKSKQPSQTQVTTFYTSIEPWIRGIKEEDIGFLEYTGDEVEPYVVPKLGRHYLDVWEEEDFALYNGPLPGFATGRNLNTLSTSSSSNAHPSTSAPQPKWDPSTLTEPDLLTEDRGHGPLTERLISALLPMPDLTVWKGVKAAEDAMEGRPGGGPGAAARKERMNVGNLEERIRDTMRFHSLLGGIPDYTEKVDDPIATALREAQCKLRKVVAINKARKERLTSIARDRLGYQEYLDLRDSIDKNISATYSKQQKKDVPKTGKKKKKVVDLTGNPNGSGDGTPVPPAPKPNPAALGLGPDDLNRLVISEPLRQLVETRRQWVDTVGGVFDRKEAQVPGSIWGVPQKTVFEGVEEDARIQLEQGTYINGDERRTNGKGKGKARGDDINMGL